MKCPVCETSDLQPVQRQGIKIDFCPQCQGVWLDRGELDQLIQQAQTTVSSARKSKRDYEQFYDKKKPQQANRQPEDRSKKRRQELDLEDFLEEIFDIFD